MSLLEVRNLKTYFATRKGEVRSVDDVSFSVELGETLSLVGESGCRPIREGVSGRALNPVLKATARYHLLSGLACAAVISISR